MWKYTYGLYQSLLIFNLLLISFSKPVKFLPNSTLILIFGVLLILIAAIINVHWEIFWHRNFIIHGSKRTIITKGIYAYIRHPFLLVIILASFGLAIAFNYLQCLVLSVISATIIFIGSKKEEDELIGKYGNKYKEYMNRVRYRFIPKVI